MSDASPQVSSPPWLDLQLVALRGPLCRWATRLRVLALGRCRPTRSVEPSALSRRHRTTLLAGTDVRGVSLTTLGAGTGCRLGRLIPTRPTATSSGGIAMPAGVPKLVVDEYQVSVRPLLLIRSKDGPAHVDNGSAQTSAPRSAH
jgi:hypothetical protein